MAHLSLSEFGDKVSEIMSVIMRQFLKNQVSEFYKMKVTMPQVIVLDLLNRQGEPKMTEMARFLDVTTAAMTGLVDRLAKEGYVTRLSDPKDRRVIRIGLTTNGYGIVKRITEKRKEMIMKMFGMVSQAEREEYLKILTHIREQVMEQKRG